MKPVTIGQSRMLVTMVKIQVVMSCNKQLLELRVGRTCTRQCLLHKGYPSASSKSFMQV